MDKIQQKRTRFTEIQEINRVVLAKYSESDESYSDQECNVSDSYNSSSINIGSIIENNLQIENNDNEQIILESERITYSSSNEENYVRDIDSSSSDFDNGILFLRHLSKECEENGDLDSFSACKICKGITTVRQ